MILNKSYFQYDMIYGDLARKTPSSEIVINRAFNFAHN